MTRTGFLVTLFAALASAQRPPIPQQLTFAPYHAGGIYAVGEKVCWTVTPGPVEPTYRYKWTVRATKAVVLKQGKLTPEKERNWDARSKEVLKILRNAGEFRPIELK